MNNPKTEAQLDLIRRCLDGDAAGDDYADLEDLLRNDPEFRSDYLLYLKVDSGLAEMPGLEQPTTSESRSSKTIPFPKWNPLNSAAAGVVIGLFCASVAWAISTTREPGQRMVIPVLTESFETSSVVITDGFPTGTGVWGGDRVHVVGGDAALQPADGAAMLSLESGANSNLGYLQQIIDVSSFPYAGEGETRTLDVVASFLADQPGEQERYTLRIATFKESPAEIHSLWQGVTWRELDESTLTMSKSGLSTPGSEVGWQTLSAVVEVPVAARSLVISLAAGRLDFEAPKTPHYIDDIRADLVIAPFTKRKRRNLKKR